MSQQYTILFGGSSFEHEISVISAITLKKVLEGKQIGFIFVSADREFYKIPADKMKSNHFSSGAYKKDAKLGLANGGFTTSGLFGSKRVDTGTIINLIHGGDGEDGKIAGMLTFYKIPFIGPRLEACAVSFNKELTKMYAQAVGVKMLDYQVIRRGEEAGIRFDFPIILKPARLGSSIGVSIVKEASELDYALDVAFEFDTDIVVEPFVAGVHEYNLAGCFTSEWNYSIIENPQKEEFLDFDKKYLDFNRSEKPQDADLPEKTAEAMRDAFRKIYGTRFAGSLIRCDFFVIDDEVYLNEINPIPGSMANYLFADFTATMDALSRSLPKEQHIHIDYLYINKIQSSKGKVR